MIDNIESVIIRELSSGNVMPKSRLYEICQCQNSTEEREARECIEKMKGTIPIGSSSSSTNGGYYWCMTKEQHDKARGELISRIASLSHSLKMLDYSFANQNTRHLLVSNMIKSWTVVDSNYEVVK